MKISRFEARGDQSGFVVPAAIVGIAIVTVLALTGLYVAQNNANSNIGIGNSWKALYAADAGAAQVLANWDPITANQMAAGDSIVTGWRVLDDGSIYRSSIVRTDAGTGDTAMFRLLTIGRPGQGLTAQRSVVTTLRSSRINEICCDAALKAQGQVKVQGTGSRVKVLGTDSIPENWESRCSETGPDQPAISMKDTTQLKVTGTPTISGSPPIAEDPTIEDSDFFQFGELTYEDLVKLADARFDGGTNLSNVGPAVDGGQCVTSTDDNWGDPLDETSPCYDYLPIVHVSGNLTLSGSGYGQGILLVDGDLAIPGDMDFYGMVLVQGEVDIRGTADLIGGVLARNGLSANDESTISGDTRVQYSSCVASTVASRASVTKPTVGRYWFEVVD